MPQAWSFENAWRVGVFPRGRTGRVGNMASLPPLLHKSTSNRVFWAFAATVLILILTITISNRGVVRIAGGVVLAGLLIWGLIQRLTMKPDLATERGKPSSPAAAVAAVPVEQIQLDDVRLGGSGAPFDLRGTIRNSNDSAQLTSITLRLVRRDCFEGALDPSGCVVIWQDQHWIPVDVPPATERKFAASFYAHTNVPRPRGTVRDEIQLVAATGQPQQR